MSADAVRSQELLRSDILQQPQALSTCLPQLRDASRSVATALRDASRVTLVGSGDSYLAGLALAQLPAARSDPWQVRTPDASIRLADHRPGEVVVGISFSGSSRRTIEAVEAARAAGSHTVTLTAAPDSELARISDDVIDIGWRGPSRAIPHATDFSTTLLAIAVLLEAVGEPIGALDGVGHAVARTLALQETVREDLTRDLRTAGRYYLLGNGDDLAVAGYGAAKLWEAGGYPAWASDPEEFGHGLHLTARPGDVAFIVGDDRRNVVERLVARLESLDMRPWTLGAAQTSERHLRTVVDEVNLAAFSNVVPLQLACLWLAQARGADVANPPDASLDTDPYQRYRSVETGSHPG